MIESFAQKGEDIRLWNALAKVKNGFYVDVGAGHPVHDSVTYAFYLRGWYGINIEPDPDMYALLARERKTDLNLPVAAGPMIRLGLFCRYEERGLYPLDPLVREPLEKAGIKHWTMQVIEMPLFQIIELIPHPTIHFLKIDVEGYEAEVLRGMDFSVHRPWILVIEATMPHTEVRSDDKWSHMLEEARYRFAHFDGLNAWYVAAEHPELEIK